MRSRRARGHLLPQGVQLLVISLLVSSTPETLGVCVCVCVEEQGQMFSCFHGLHNGWELRDSHFNCLCPFSRSGTIPCLSYVREASKG